MTTQTLEAEKFEALRETWSEDNDCLSHRSVSGGVNWRLIPAFW